ncbi:hypothetical protein AGR7C_pTi0010 [Agrobacterium deltaense Zutra 3/1]|uniref:Uncharacterized protein n=1 Tax=Agrobacterium deltaense Zutra 3/1 TaxID=1183427 RepID=A0A1S7S4U6_9HYPH|nr:hypothetical protein AGR7C_pTi0010 [Agrobacterium deltaense Zutra 3/1]
MFYDLKGQLLFKAFKKVWYRMTSKHLV